MSAVIPTPRRPDSAPADVPLTDPRPAVAEPARLAAVGSYCLTGQAGIADLDAVVAYMARTVEAPIAVINLVGPDAVPPGRAGRGRAVFAASRCAAPLS